MRWRVTMSDLTAEDKAKAFKKIQAGLVEALSVARGDAEPSRMHVANESDDQMRDSRLPTEGSAQF